jgi:hypothetical protein
VLVGGSTRRPATRLDEDVQAGLPRRSVAARSWRRGREETHGNTLVEAGSGLVEEKGRVGSTVRQRVRKSRRCHRDFFDNQFSSCGR